MAVSAAVMPEGVTLAADERVVASGTFRFSTLLFFLNWNMAVTSKRLVGKTPNTILGIIPLGSTNVSYPLPNIAGVVTKTRVSLPWILIGLILLLVGLGGANGPNIVAIIIGLLGLAAAFHAQIFITNSGGGTIGHNVAFFDRGVAAKFVQEVNTAIAAHAHQTPVVMAAAPSAAPQATGVSDSLAELARLRDAGHLSAEEFDTKRREIIGRL